MLVVAWILLTVGIGVWASRWNRSGLGWALLSLLVTPLIAAILLLMAGNKTKKKFIIRTNEDGTQSVTEQVVRTKTTIDEKWLQLQDICKWLLIAIGVYMTGAFCFAMYLAKFGG